jgi:UDPglucose 6-dehydrogenase
MELSIIGAGYVGLVSAVCFADRGYSVVLVERDPEKVKLINQAIPPFYETGLEETLKRVVGLSRLRANIGPEDAVLNSDVTFIAVGTPNRADGSIDLSYVTNSSIEIGKVLKRKTGYHLVAVGSTVIPGTTENLVKPAIEKHSEKKAGRDFGLVMQPEFLREGSAIYDTMNPDRIVIGEYDQESGEILESLYKEFYKEKLPPTLHMNLASAEMIKYASNAFLATKISFINEIANICEKVPDTDVVKVAQGMGLDKRIGREFLNAGPGFGGSCFPKDLKAIVSFAKKNRYEPRILESVLKVNGDQAIHVVKLARKQLGILRGKRIAVLGLSFKPGSDDLREAPSLKIIGQLLKEHATVVAYDPVALNNAKEVLGKRIEYADSARSCLENADTALIVTEWDEFRKLTPADFKDLMRHPIIIDARRIYDPAIYGSETRYTAIGLGHVPPDNSD